MSTRTIGPGSGSGLLALSRVRASVEFADGSGAFQRFLDELLNPYSVREVETRQLASGANTINIPVHSSAQAGGVFIVMPYGNSTVTLIVKGVTGDTGIQVERDGWIFLTFDASAASTQGSIVLTASAQLANVMFIWV